MYQILRVISYPSFPISTTRFSHLKLVDLQRQPNCQILPSHMPFVASFSHSSQEVESMSPLAECWLALCLNQKEVMRFDLQAYALRSPTASIFTLLVASHQVKKLGLDYWPMRDQGCSQHQVPNMWVLESWNFQSQSDQWCNILYLCYPIYGSH